MAVRWDTRACRAFFLCSTASTEEGHPTCFRYKLFRERKIYLGKGTM